MRLRFCLILLFSACSQQTDQNHSDETATTSATGVTWYTHIEPLIQKNCAACHHSEGVGGLDLTTPETARDNAMKMAVYVESGAMPLPAANPDCRDYKGSEQMVLTDDEVQHFRDWADDSAPLGNPDNAPDPIDWSQSLEDPDLKIHLPVKHSVETDASGNDYRCFELENPFDAPTYITAFDVDLDNAAIVHHMILAIDTGKNAGTYTGDEDLSDGWYCGDRIIETDWSLLHAWTPGQLPLEFKPGDGMLVNPDDQLVLQMHYYYNGSEPLEDQSGYLLKTASEVDRNVLMYPYGPVPFTIPAGASEHTESASLTNPYFDFEVLGVFPHMHWLGTEYRAWVTNEDGESTECLVDADRYDFDHQSTYMYKEPAIWRKGETVHTSCTWDNSENNPNQYNHPPQDIEWGEGTNEEMCFFLFYFTAL